MQVLSVRVSEALSEGGRENHNNLPPQVRRGPPFPCLNVGQFHDRHRQWLLRWDVSHFQCLHSDPASVVGMLLSLGGAISTS